ncbi:Protein kinase domain protein [Acididesulfobacillus acetoxydans]|uniref:non-specific serine/threonine protein kinase n=1 Tax=Acididesulfobacillus acetoxydans TaxID=1561005 RepID=A0A8S0WHJ5_9FIRM|nr:Stk1 family PASTA domain-containing Ser/Thr kinase [Acididesulfobacillus acetoxydans]CAA7602752.1 Protein kinase domain protein [Acididesulfobacillus acetoxydans]CEJ06391.1 Serine/threonine-protein kinase PrkC [Acididesulfobacillus acetoxydans]
MSKVFGGRYEVIERIGAGGMAIVYKAKDLLLNRIVTVKVLREQFLSDEDFVKRFRREAQSAASLSHPNIVSIYDVGKDGNIEYIVMEYVEGRDLKEIIREFAPLSPEQAINLTRQIGEAIRHAHQHHIIHRDIKPHNILVTAEGRAKVTDFGIARAVSAATVTHTGDIVGSVHYLSPEQAKGLPSDERSDLYSLGIILYELLTGKVPYDGETPIAVALKHLQEVPPRPSQLNPRVGPDLENVIMRAIAKPAEQRYATAGDFLADLEKVRSGQPVPKPEEPMDLDATQVHRGVRPLTETAGRMNSNPAEERPAESAAPGRQRKKRRRWPWVVTAIVVLALLGAGLWLRSYLTVGDTVVPSLEGKTVKQAEALLQQYKLVLGPDNSAEYSDTVPKNEIISQVPAANSPVKIGHEVTVVVSKGAQLMKFPNLINPPLSKENALIAIGNANFTATPTITEVPSSTVPAGSVVAQDPPPDTLWHKDGNIQLTISTGPQVQTISMPNVVGKSAAEAAKILQAHNLTPVTDSQDSTQYPKGMVIKTNPAANSPVQQGANVTITVSRGPGPIG